MNARRTLIVGVGSSHGDDQAGWIIADEVAARLHSQQSADTARVRKATSPSQLLDWLDAVNRLIICDACRGLGDIGTTRHWIWPASELKDVSWSSTHDLPLPAVLQLAERLGSLPAEIQIYAVEGATCQTLAAMTPEVAAELPGIVTQIIHELTRHDA